ncbi:hypothetical protein BHC46_01040 [Snodgrassella alvi]|uniref:Uncharacterized protein n=1 Tax=Snodgrassella alvi TaxID=1196083 RepID=A0A2N9XPL7_9NEIS|nr:hypothetical protein BHC46_01040 [Snodgrassella alvi]
MSASINYISNNCLVTSIKINQLNWLSTIQNISSARQILNKVLSALSKRLFCCEINKFSQIKDVISIKFVKYIQQIFKY